MTEEKLLNGGDTFGAKRLQGLCQTMHSVGALGVIGMWSTVAHINKLKLLFFGTLCRISFVRLGKRLFVRRLFSFLVENESGHLGFVCDIERILQLYNLYYPLTYRAKRSAKVLISTCVESIYTVGD